MLLLSYSFNSTSDNLKENSQNLQALNYFSDLKCLLWGWEQHLTPTEHSRHQARKEQGLKTGMVNTLRTVLLPKQKVDKDTTIEKKKEERMTSERYRVEGKCRGKEDGLC